jgi:hypothetical protein
LYPFLNRYIREINTLNMPTDINTITAWCVVISTIITALTGFFIVQTFQLQAKVAMEQSKITKLEVERSLLYKRPLFLAKRVEPHPYWIKGDLIAYLLEIELLRGDIFGYNVDFTPNEENENSLIQYGNFPRIIAGGLIEGSKLDLEYYIKKEDFVNAETKSKTGSLLSFSINFTFKDILGNDYKQEIIVPHHRGPIAKPPFIPQLWDKLEDYKRD